MSNVSIENAIFHAAILLADPQQRDEYLDVACQGDTELLARITTLLEAKGDDSFMQHRAIDSIINQPVQPPKSPSKTSDAEPTSQSVGIYKLLQQIGEGGFGTVYMAEQESPVRCRVASHGQSGNSSCTRRGTGWETQPLCCRVGRREAPF